MEISRAKPATVNRGMTPRPDRRLRGLMLACAALVLLALAFTGVAQARIVRPFANTKPEITKNPVSIVVEAGQPATFEAAATGTAPVTVQWESSFNSGISWKEILHANSTTYTIAKALNSESGLKFRAKFTNKYGEAVTTAASLTVGEKPVITKEPSNVAVGVGSTAIFEATASGSPTPEIQWELSENKGASWSEIAGEHLPTLDITPPSLSYSGFEYRARFTNTIGAKVNTLYTKAAILTVQSLAKVTEQPEEQTVIAGTSATFESASTGGFPEPEVQWEVSTDEGAVWSDVAGAHSDRLTISPALQSDSGYEYRAAFINSAGTAYSEGAFLYVAANDYSAFGWGLNVHGQAGVGSNESTIPSPLPIKGLNWVTAVSGGMRHSLALLANGTVDAWGFNGRGQLGNEDETSTRVPEPVEHLKHVVAVAAGGSHSLALLANGTVMAWGDNESGQLGVAKAPLESEVPLPVEGLTGVKAIAAGEEDSLALLANGTVMAWGNNERGQLGTGGKASKFSPTPVLRLTGVKAIAAGGQFGLALLENGTVEAWGDDQHGQLGSKAYLEESSERPEEEGFYSPAPIPVEGLSGVTAIAAGRTHALALLSNGTVESWGNDTEGELGNGTIEPQGTTPAAVSGLTGVSAISAGDQESVALLSSGGIEAWGSNNSGTLGDGVTGAPSDLPVEVHNIGGAAGISAGASQVIAFGASLPAVTGVSPQSGPTGGGQNVTITGTGLGAATAVHFGATAATGLIVNSPDSVTVTSPAGTGTVDITVTTPTGTSPTGGADRYSYRPAPTVTKLSAKSGPAVGGTSVTITGDDFTGTTKVEFGNVAVTPLSVSESTITVLSPANAGGTADVRVTTLSGTSPITTKDHFKYIPSVEGVSPGSGPVAGGTSVTITGSGFAIGTSATAFKFGKAKVTAEECTSTTTCTVTAPGAKTAGTVTVTVEVAKAKGVSAPAAQFTYE